MIKPSKMLKKHVEFHYSSKLGLKLQFFNAKINYIKSDEQEK